MTVKKITGTAAIESTQKATDEGRREITPQETPVSWAEKQSRLKKPAKGFLHDPADFPVWY